MDSNLKPRHAHGSQRQFQQLGTFGDSFTPSCAQRRHNMENPASNQASSIGKNAENTSENGRFEDFGLGRLCRPVIWIIWTSTWAEVAPKSAHWGQGAPSWRQVGPKLEPSRPKLGQSWGRAGRSGPQVGPIWADVAAMLDRNGPSGRSWAHLQNVQIASNYYNPMHFFAIFSKVS